MPAELPASSGERRKQLRFRLRPDLRFDPRVLDGKKVFGVKDPLSLRYFQFPEREFFLMRRMDGNQRLEDIQKEFEAAYAPDTIRLEDLESFAHQLVQMGLVQGENPDVGQVLFEQRQKQRFWGRLRALTNVLFIKIPIYDPDMILTRGARGLWWVFTPAFLLLSLCLPLAALLLVGTHFEGFRHKLPDMREFFTFGTAVSLWFAVAIVKIIHELGHGLTCKAFGGEVHETGILLLCLSPSLYCNVSDSLTMEDKWKRMMVSFAGIYVELMIAAAATFVWWYTPGSPFLNQLCLCLMVVCSVSTVVFNANPLLRFDGYYMLATWIEIPDLREQANRYVQRLVMEHGLGIELHPDPPMSPLRKVLYTLYAVGSYCYGWVMVWGILWFLYQFLRPYKLGTFGALVAMIVAGMMIGGPIYRLLKSLHERAWRLPPMKPRRVTVTVGLVVAILLVVLCLPLPVSRIRQTALIQVRADAKEMVFVEVPGVLTRLHVRDGQVVGKGDILAELSNLELDRQLDEARVERDIRAIHVQSLVDQSQENADPQRRAKLGVEIAQATGERNTLAKQVRVLEERKSRLQLRAPRPGVVISPPNPEELGKYFERDQAAPFCSVGSLGELAALVPVTPAEYQLLVSERERNGVTAATIRVRGREATTWVGEVSALPESEAKQVPLPLTKRGSGPIAIKAGTQANAHIPQDQVYLVAIVFSEADAAIRPGNLAQVKIHCRWRTTAWWLWRAFSSTFEPSL